MPILMVVDHVADMKTLLPLGCAMALAEETSLCLLRRLPPMDAKAETNGSNGTNGNHATSGTGNDANGGAAPGEKLSKADASTSGEIGSTPSQEDAAAAGRVEANAPSKDDAPETHPPKEDVGNDPPGKRDATTEGHDTDASHADKAEAVPADPDAARRDAFTRAADAAVKSIATSLQRAAPACKVVFLTDGDHGAGLLREMQARNPTLTLLPATLLPKKHAEEWVYALSEKTGCDILVCQAKAPIGIPRRILIPASGGVHSLAALRLTKAFLSVTGGDAVCLTVETLDDPDAGEIATHRARRILAKAGIQDEDAISPVGVGAADPHDVILARAKDETELVLVGAGPRKRGRLRGTTSLPKRLLEEDAAEMVGVMYRAPRGAGQVWGQVRAQLRAMLPALARERRIDIFEQIRDGSRFGIDFGLLLALSSAIAALGLMQDSTAVVIGAMLVAPLMTPIIGFALAIVQGNVRLAKDCLLSILLGILIAVAGAALLGVVVGAGGLSNGLTSELQARCGPGLLDVGVAVFSGMAGAYAIARPNLSGAVAGVAIAAALVPPLSTTGILLSWGEMRMAEGAFLLFTVNLVAIIVGAFLAFRLVGLGSGSASGTERAWPLRTLVFLILAILLFVTVFSYTPTRSRWMGGKRMFQQEPEADPPLGEGDA